MAILTSKETLEKLKQLQEKIQLGEIENPFFAEDVEEIISSQELENAQKDGLIKGDNDDGYTLDVGANLDYLYQKAILLDDIKTNEAIPDFSFLSLIKGVGINDISSFNADLELYHELIQAVINSQNDYSLLTPKLSALGALLDFINDKAKEENKNEEGGE